MKNKVSDRRSVVETELAQKSKMPIGELELMEEKAQKPKKKMGGGMMKKKNYAKGGKVIKGPYS